MKTNSLRLRGFTLVELLVVIVIIAALAGLTAPMVIRQARKADQAEAISNARQIGIAMFEFQNDYGSFPDATTKTVVVANNADSDVVPNETDSNGYFRQLFVASITQSEKMFYAKTGLTVKPDGVIKGDDCLKAKECGFGYMLNTDKGLTASGNPSRVVAMAPLNASGKFNPDPFDKKAVLLHIDNSVDAVTIDANGEAIIGGGKKLTTNGADSIWGADITPTIKIPGA